MKFVDKLRRMGACEEGLAWVGDRTLEQAWVECTDSRWMIWYLGKVGTHQDVVRSGCACARTALKYVPEGEDRPLRAIEAAEAWVRGEATVEQVRSATYAGEAAAVYAADAAAAYAAYAAIYAADAVFAAACDAYAATYAAAYAADAAAANAAGYAAVYAAMCDIIRAMWPTPPTRKRGKAVTR